jgi:deoxyribonuclease V
MDEKEVEVRFKDLIEKYNLDLGKLRREQLKLAKNLKIEDSMDFSLADRIAGIDNVFYKNIIISAIVIMQDGEIIEQEYIRDKIRFPYIPSYRAYRELPTMVAAFNLLDEKPDVIFVRGHGILHPREIGLASHFSLAVNVPTVGVADSLIIGKEDEGDVRIDGKLFGQIVKTKEGAKPLYVSPGNMISVESAAELVKRNTIEPHKVPEPLRVAKKYAKEIRKELFKI